MNLKDIENATAKVQRLKSLTNDISHLQELAFKMANNEKVKLNFRLDMEWEEHDNKLAAQQALKKIDSDGDHDDLQNLLNMLRQSMADSMPPGMEAHIVGAGEAGRDKNPTKIKKHELDGEISDVVGLQILGVFLAHKIEEKGKIEEELRILGVEIDSQKTTK